MRFRSVRQSLLGNNDLAGRKFPLNEDHTDMLWTDADDEDLVMSVCNPGIDLCWDDVAELIECPENWNKDVGLMLLALYAVFLGEFVERVAVGFLGWRGQLVWMGGGTPVVAVSPSGHVENGQPQVLPAAR